MSAYISEIDTRGGVGSEFVEIAAPAGTDLTGYSLYVYDTDGTVLSGPYGLAAADGSSNGKDVYVIDDTDGLPGIQQHHGVALVDDSGNAVQFLSFSGQMITATEGPANGQESRDIGAQSEGGSTQSDDGGATYYQQSTSNRGTVPCYGTCTLIETPQGPRAVETLKAGDLIYTLDHGPQQIRWVRSASQPLETISMDARPVLIAAGALGKGVPAHDLIVSPQHRILVGGEGQLTQYFDAKAFAPAKSLTGLHGIRHMGGKTEITWVHFSCDQHEVVIANGCYSESLLLGPMVMNGLTRAEHQSVTRIYEGRPSNASALLGSAAYECLKVGEVRRRLAKRKNKNQWTTATEIRKWDCDLAMEKYEDQRLRAAVG